ncbi:hypothetical protein [Calothrix sp. PCC 7507]|uniref:hypothetical protein n=1 Tax=Calothrix sp. PCC 7507 TaxID=99598 RepID=UPI00135F1A4F|nr:hypothetical protein [Calothrix sp. PCC 7507]
MFSKKPALVNRLTPVFPKNLRCLDRINSPPTVKEAPAVALAAWCIPLNWRLRD